MLALNCIHCIDALSGLKQLDDDLVDCVVTSPPYWATRDYGVSKTCWRDGSEAALGLESKIEEYIAHLLEVFMESKRVLKPSGTLWVNIGDTYAGSWGNYAYLQKSGSKAIRPPSSFPQSVRRKSLCCIPERFILGMIEQGWTLRNRIAWHKPNYLPSSVKDRFSATWEYLLLFVKSDRYYFDLDAVRVPHVSRQSELKRALRKARPWRRSLHIHGRRMPPEAGQPQSFHPRGKNPGDCWQICPHTKPLLGKGMSGGTSAPPRHPAVYPEELCIRPILAGCPTGGVVLDPFIGSGTTAIAAQKLGRKFIGFELNAQYVALANARLIELQLQSDSAAAEEEVATSA